MPEEAKHAEALELCVRERRGKRKDEVCGEREGGRRVVQSRRYSHL
jgi:hypothetical protein